MRDGLSLLWGEVVAAAELDYELTAVLQVVCPVCKAPLFKVVRDLGLARPAATSPTARRAGLARAPRSRSASGA